MAAKPAYRKQQAGHEVPYLHEGYKSTVVRSPSQPLVELPQTLSEITGPMFERDAVQTAEMDMTRHAGGEALGQRIIVSGRVTDEDGRPVPDMVVELWQCNAAGRYRHENDRHDAPLDPHFTGTGRTVTDARGDYRFLTIEPGAYPWGNHENGWRPKHIHFSLFGPALATRLITQMYFPGDPLLELDPIYQAVPDPEARRRLVSTFDLERTEPGYALAYRFDIVLRGRGATPATEN